MKIGKHGFEIVSMHQAAKAGWPGSWHWLPITYTKIWQLKTVCRWLWFAWGWNKEVKL